MKRWKNQIVLLTAVILSGCLAVFLFFGYTALYWAWLRGNFSAAVPYLPWARNFGMLGMAAAGAATGILFSSRTFPITPRTRLVLSILATAMIGFFAEFRNEGKFYFKTLVHFFGPTTRIHGAFNQLVPSLGEALYRIEYSHWNDFLMGPAIVSVLFAVVFAKIYATWRNQEIGLGASGRYRSADLDDVLRFARILMNVGLFWFFIQAWGEKAGYWRNPHSSDEIDLPFEFAGTMLGFWMARVLTKPFDENNEEFRSTFFIDFLSSGVAGLLYTLIIGPLSESVASTIAHALYPVVPGSLNFHEYTPLQQHIRPIELLLLAGAMWWSLNRSSKSEELVRLTAAPERVIEEGMETPERKWGPLMSMVMALAVIGGYLLVLAAVLTLLEPQGLVWTAATLAAALGAGTLALLLINHGARQGFTTVLGRKTVEKE